MNCDAARRRLLVSERPERPPDEVRRHLADCATCRVWGRRLAQAERDLRLLPLPPSSSKDAFVRRFLRPAGPVVRHVPWPWPTPAKERGLQKLSLAVAIAAVLAVFALGRAFWPHNPVLPPRPEPTWVVKIRNERERYIALPTQRERVEKLAGLAADLQTEVRALTKAGDADKLTDLVEVYGGLLREDLAVHASGLPPAQRSAVLGGVAEQLRGTESELSRLAAHAEQSDPSTARPLQELARAAREGGLHVRALLRDAA